MKHKSRMAGEAYAESLGVFLVFVGLLCWGFDALGGWMWIIIGAVIVIVVVLSVSGSGYNGQ